MSYAFVYIKGRWYIVSQDTLDGPDEWVRVGDIKGFKHLEDAKRFRDNRLR